ncbi:MAG: DUF732 domain-containing protein [Gloeomargaritales cyanobacterium]
MVALSAIGCAATNQTHVSDQLFIANLDKGNVPHTDDSQTIKLGHSVCTQLDSGVSFVSVGLSLMSTGLDVNQAGFLIGTSIGAYCPSHTGLISAATAS